MARDVPLRLRTRTKDFRRARQALKGRAVHPLLDILRRDATRFGPELAEAAHARGLAVTQKDGTTRAIPVTATPVILPAEEIRRRADSATLLSRATFKMAQATLKGPDSE